MARASDLLTIWEAGVGHSPLRRTQRLAGFVPAFQSEDAPAAPSIGATNAGLLALRRALFGAHMTALAHCPACETQLEARIEVEELLAAHPRGEAPVFDLQTELGAIRFRLPTLDDLAAIAADAAPERAADALLQACVVQSETTDTIGARDLAIARMAELDPLADPTIALTCDACGVQFESAFDIAGFLWREIEAATKRTFREVHVLASRYGWAEADLLAMSAARRQVYLDLIGA